MVLKAMTFMKPDLIITFGAIAFKAVSKVTNIEIVKSAHPASRQTDIKIQLI
jgi:uracil-DNA glycosylase